MNIRKILAVILSVLVSAVLLRAQETDEKLSERKSEKEFFYVDPLVFYPYDSAVGRADVYLELPLENLQFKKSTSGDNYDVSIEYRISIKDASGFITVNQSYNELITNTKNEQKNLSDKSLTAVKSFFLKSGNYKLTFTLKDKNNNAEKSKDYDLKVKNPLLENLNMSDILLLSDFKVNQTGEKEIIPLISCNVGMLENFFLFWEIRNRDEQEIFKSYRVKVSDTKERNLLDTTIYLTLKKGTNTVVQRIINDKFYIGDFILTVYDGAETVNTKNFYYRWSDYPVNIKDLDKAISQMMYIATSDELDYIKDGKSKEERMKRFVKFWKDKDPSPGTPKNELMNVYYNRVKIANERYSHYVEGWKTDMGMVFIIFGNPSSIERHPFENYSKPYEIWSYYEYNRQYVFVDDSGFGDYRLVTPIYDERTRIRY